MKINSVVSRRKGGTNIFTLTFSDPAYGSSRITNYLDAGVYQAIGLNLGRVDQEQLTRLKEKLEATKVKLENNDFGTLGKDDLVGDLLNTTALTYHAELGAMNHITAKTMQVNALTLPSETIFATKLKVLTLFGIPRYVQAGGLSMDADHLMQVAKAKDGKNDTVKQYMRGSGMTSSALEHSVPEQLFSTPDNPAEAISTVKALQIANNQGIPIYSVNQSNLAAVLPQLQIDSQIKTDIQNAVNAGKFVTVSKRNISFNGWNGCGYIITDPETGAGAYMISGGTSGAILFMANALIGLILIFVGASMPIALLFSAYFALMSSSVSEGCGNVILTFLGLFSGYGASSLLTILLSPEILLMSVRAIPFSFIVIVSLLVISYIFALSLYYFYANYDVKEKNNSLFIEA